MLTIFFYFIFLNHASYIFKKYSDFCYNGIMEVWWCSLARADKVVGPDTTTNVIHNIYPNGLSIPEHMMDQNVGGKLKRCRHVYEYVNAKVCPDCGRDTHEPDWNDINAKNKQWLKDNPLAYKEVGWWSI